MKKLVIILFLLVYHAALTHAEVQPCNCEWDADFKSVYCNNNILCLIDATGGVEEFLGIYDLRDMTHAHLADLICFQDAWKRTIGPMKYDIYSGVSAYNYMIAFYEVIGRKPNEFAKSMIRKFIFQDIKERPRPVYNVAGWEYLRGEILPVDTLLGKQYLSLASGVSVDSLELYILPFWRDSIARNIYKHRHDSVLNVWGKRWEYPAAVAVLEYGDTLAYRKLMRNDQYGDHMIYSIYMIDQYSYIPAYQDIYLALKKRYAQDHKQMGKYTLQWLYNLFTENNIVVPTPILEAINKDME